MNCLEVKPSSSATVSSVKDGLEFPITTLSLRHNVIMWVCMCVCVGVLERRGHILKWLHTATVPTLVRLLLQPAYKCERFKGVCSDRDNWNSLHCSLKKSKQVSWGGGGIALVVINLTALANQPWIDGHISPCRQTQLCSTMSRRLNDIPPRLKICHQPLLFPYAHTIVYTISHSIIEAKRFLNVSRS